MSSPADKHIAGPSTAPAKASKTAKKPKQPPRGLKAIALGALPNAHHVIKPTYRAPIQMADTDSDAETMWSTSDDDEEEQILSKPPKPNPRFLENGEIDPFYNQDISDSDMSRPPTPLSAYYKGTPLPYAQQGYDGSYPFPAAWDISSCPENFLSPYTVAEMYRQRARDAAGPQNPPDEEDFHAKRASEKAENIRNEGLIDGSMSFHAGRIPPPKSTTNTGPKPFVIPSPEQEAEGRRYLRNMGKSKRQIAELDAAAEAKKGINDGYKKEVIMEFRTVFTPWMSREDKFKKMNAEIEAQAEEIRQAGGIPDMAALRHAAALAALPKTDGPLGGYPDPTEDELKHRGEKKKRGRPAAPGPSKVKRGRRPTIDKGPPRQKRKYVWKNGPPNKGKGKAAAAKVEAEEEAKVEVEESDDGDDEGEEEVELKMPVPKRRKLDKGKGKAIEQ